MNDLIYDFKNDFKNKFSYIYFEDFVSDKKIGEWIEENMKYDYNMMLEYFADYCISQGLCEVVE